MRSEPDNQNSVISHCYFKTDAPRALVFRPLVKGNEALGTRLSALENALERCVMRRETGLRAPDCYTVQKNGGKNSMWSDAKKRLLLENSTIFQRTFSAQNFAISFWSCGPYRMGLRCKIRNDFAWNKSRFFKTRYFSCRRARIKMFIPDDIK